MYDKKVEIIYFYSNLQEDESELSNASKKISQKRRDINIHLINVDDPTNEELAQLYEVDIVPTLIFLTPGGEVAARLSVSLSAEEVIQEIADKISAGELPNPAVEEKRREILENLKNIDRRSDLTDIIIEQIADNLMEAITKSEIIEIVNSHISAVNHTIRDLEEIRRILKKHQKPHEIFIV